MGSNQSFRANVMRNAVIIVMHACGLKQDMDHKTTQRNIKQKKPME